MTLKELIVKLKLNYDGSAEKKYQQSLSNIHSGAQKVQKGFLSMGSIIKTAVGYMAVKSFTNLGVSIMNTAGEVEQYRVALGAMMGDQEKANRIIHELDYSAVSDFYGTAATIGGLQGMVTFGMQAEEAQDALTRLADIAQGDVEAFKSLSLNMGQVFSKGKADGMDIKQFVQRGFDVIGEVAKVTGRSREEIEKAGVTYDMVAMALKNVTKEGGKYNGMLDKQSQTLPGVLKRITSVKLAIMEAIGFSVNDDIKDLLNGILRLIKESQDGIVEAGSKVMKVLAKAGANILIAFEEISNKTKGFFGLRQLAKSIGAVIANIASYVFALIYKLSPFLDFAAKILSKVFIFLGWISEYLMVVVTVLGTALVIFKAISVVMGIINAIATASPVTWIIWGIVAAILAVIALVYLVIKHWDKIRDFVKKLCDKIVQFFVAMGNKIKSIWQGIVDRIIKLWGNITSFFSKGVDFAVQGWEGVIDFFQDLWGIISEVFQKGVDWIKLLFTNPIEAIKVAWNGIIDFYKDLWKGIIGVFTAGWDKIKSIAGFFTGFFGGKESSISVEHGGELATQAIGTTSSIQNSSSDVTLNSNANFTINVPPGTTQEQARIISQQVKQEMNASFMDLIGSSRGMVPVPEARGW